MKTFVITAISVIIALGMLTGCRSKSPEGTDSPTSEVTETSTNHRDTEDFTGTDDGMSRNRRFSSTK